MNLDPKTDLDPDPDPGSTKILDPDPRFFFKNRDSDPGLSSSGSEPLLKNVAARSFIIQNPSFYPSPFKINRNVIYSLNYQIPNDQEQQS